MRVTPPTTYSYEAVVGIWFRLSMLVMRWSVKVGSMTCFMRSAKPLPGLKTRVKTGPTSSARMSA